MYQKGNKIPMGRFSRLSSASHKLTLMSQCCKAHMSVIVIVHAPLPSLPLKNVPRPGGPRARKCNMEVIEMIEIIEMIGVIDIERDHRDRRDHRDHRDRRDHRDHRDHSPVLDLAGRFSPVVVSQH